MERPNARGANSFVVGMFVFIAFLVGAGFVVFMGGSSIFGKEMRLRSHFADVRGLNVGAPIFLAGIQVGRVAAVEYPHGDEEKAGGVDVIISVFSQFTDRIHKDGEASINTQGVLGDKVLVISPGTFGNPLVKNGDLLASHKEPELSDYFAKGADVIQNVAQLTVNLNGLIEDIRASGRVKTILANLDKVSANLAVSSKEDLQPVLKGLKNIITKIDKGEGTLGALINDPSLHEDLRAVLGGAKRSGVVRFLVREAIAGNEKKDTKEKKQQ